jgi:CMP-N-acetylneuraminic acid synthetase
MELGNVIAHIPARGGSKRVQSKNLRYMAGKPMIAYAIESALGSSLLNGVFVNTDDDSLEAFAQSLDCNVYRRPASLGGDDATGEDFTYDFIKAKNPDTLVLINPVCPLIRPKDIDAALKAYAESDADTLIGCTQTQMQSFVGEDPINIIADGPLAPSQNNRIITICNWAVTVWNANTFKELYERNRSGYFGKNRLFWPLDPLVAVKVSEEKDFRLAEALLIAKKNTTSEDDMPKYWSK